MPKGDSIMKAFRVMEMFKAGPVTARMIADEFNITRMAAHHWIDRASVVMPVYESGKYYNPKGGAPGKVFELLK